MTGPALALAAVPCARPVVLLVDGHADSLDMYALMLTSSGFDVDTASNASQAAARIATRVPAAVALEITLAGELSGYDFCRRMRSESVTRSVPLVAVTARAFPSEQAQAHAAGCDLVLTKPCLPDALVAAVRRLLQMPPADTPHEAIATRATPSIAEGPQPTKGPRAPHVLLVDDAPEIRSLFGRILTRSGMAVTFAEDGVGGLDSVRDQQPDVLVCDLDMPNMGGIALCRALRADPATRDVRILVVSGDGRSQTTAALDAGCDAVLVKPCSGALLVRAIERLLTLPAGWSQRSGDPAADADADRA
jgi:two-component system, cell cycle response regulator DivK